MPMPALGLFSVENPMNKAMEGYGQAANTFGSMTKSQKQTTTPPDKTLGGGLMSAGGMATTGFIMGGPTGAAIGAGVGALAYFLS